VASGPSKLGVNEWRGGGKNSREDGDVKSPLHGKPGPGGKRGSGLGPHGRPYDEIQFVREGRGSRVAAG
jgi:hypothetical protein